MSLANQVQWTIDPCELNFRLMPAAMVPTALQLEVPHPAVIDLIPLYVSVLLTEEIC